MMGHYFLHGVRVRVYIKLRLRVIARKRAWDILNHIR